MGGFLLLAENRSVPYPRSPFSFGHLLHLLYEFAPANQGLVPTWRPASMKVRISLHSVHSFRSKPVGRFARSRSVISLQAVPSFRSKPVGDGCDALRAAGS